MQIQKFILVMIASILVITSCDTYPEYETEYSPAYPLSGEYMVKKYVPDSIEFQYAKTGYFDVFIYASSLDAENYLWVYNTGENSFRIKTDYSIDNLNFDCDLLPSVTSAFDTEEDASKFVTISQSTLITKEWPTPDSIQFRVAIYDTLDVLIDDFVVAGHRTTGTEVPYWDNHL